MPEPVPERQSVAEPEAVVEGDRMTERGVAEAGASNESGMSHASHMSKRGMATGGEPNMSAHPTTHAMPAHATAHAMATHATAHAAPSAGKRGRTQA